MKQRIMTPQEFKEFDERVRDLILAKDPDAVISSELAPFTIPIGGIEEIRAVWTVSGIIPGAGSDNPLPMYNYVLWMKDGPVWELLANASQRTTSGNRKYLSKVLQEFYDNIDTLDIPGTMIDIKAVSIDALDNRQSARIAEAVAQTLDAVTPST